MSRRPRQVDEYELEELNARSGPAAAAARAAELVATGRLPENTSRAQLLVELGEYRQMSGDASGAGEAFREAVADGGGAAVDPRLSLARFCWETGDSTACDALLAEVWAGRSTNPFDYEWAAELLEERGDLAGALRWANTGAFRALRDESMSADLAAYLFIVRRRIRLAMGFTEDDHDILAAPHPLPGSADGTVASGQVLGSTKLGLGDDGYEYFVDVVTD